MAGDWIKMRGNLWDDPRVARICDLTDQSEAAVIGGLYWLWATADQHTEDGILPGLTLRSIDRKTGISSFGDALVQIGWLADHPEGVRIIKFEEHNGASAKRRASEAQRKANARSSSASDADNQQTDYGQNPPSCGAREREEKEKRRDKPPTAERASRLPADWEPSDADVEFCRTERPDLQPSSVASQFRDYWVAQPGAKGRKADWPATWRNWVRNQRANAPPRASPTYQTRLDQQKQVLDELTGRSRSHDPDDPFTIEATARIVG